MKIRLGKKYQDKITGTAGTATSITEHLYGCRRIGLTLLKNDGEPAEYYFDEPALLEVKEPRRVKPKQDTGGPHGFSAGPPRTGLR